MLAAYVASSEMLALQRATLGETHPTVAGSTKSEIAHLSNIFRQSPPDRDDVTKFMAHVNHDRCGVFTKTQKDSLIDAAAIRLSTTVAIDGVAEIHSDLRAGQRLQTNLFSFRYYTAAQWTIFCSLVTSMVVKFREMSRIWLSWGLVYPSGPTFRIGLATLHVASDSIVSSKTAHEQLDEFKEEFKIIRGHRRIGATLKTFPSQPSAYSLLYPSQLPSFVDCRVDSKLIEEHACKEHIPIKANNARLTGKTTPTKAGIAAGGQDRDLMSEMLTFVLNRSPSSSPPPDRGTSSANTAHANQPRGASTLPIGNAPPLALGDVSHDAEPPIVVADTEHVASHVASASSLAPDVKADGEPANKKARRGKLDHIDGLLVGYKNAKAAMKKPAGAKKGRKKVVEKERGGGGRGGGV